MGPAMEYRRFGKTNEMLSVITLGGMRFKHGWDAPRDRLPKVALDNCIDSTRRAFECGINHLETAYGYMKSEHLFGAALKEIGRPREEYRVMTKGAPMTGEETGRWWSCSSRRSASTMWIFTAGTASTTRSGFKPR